MTTNTIVELALIVSIVLTVVLLALIVLRSRSEKKNYFLFCAIGLMFYLVGSYMEVSSFDVGGALAGVKVMYIGICIMPPMLLLFIADYCEIRLPAFVKPALAALMAFNAVSVWTADKTGLFYRGYIYTDMDIVHGLRVLGQGPLYFVVFGTTVTCGVLAIVLTLWVMRQNWEHRAYRQRLFFILATSVGPFVANIGYTLATYVAHADPHGVNFTAYTIIATYLALYLGVLRYDFFDYSSITLQVLFNTVRDAYLTFDTRFHFMLANKTARSIFPGLNNLDKDGDITEMALWPKELRSLDAAMQDSGVDFSLMPPGEEEARSYTAWTRSVKMKGRQIGYILQIQDVTEKVRLQNRLENEANSDVLVTSLYNRRYFMKQAVKELDRAKRMRQAMSVLIMDIDRFKEVNDSYGFGHAAGDAALVFVGYQLQHVVRPYDLVARYGGDEFMILFADTNTTLGAQLAERVRATIERAQFAYKGTPIPDTCSIGIASCDDGSEDLVHMLRRADAALYRAKKEGRNKVCVAEQEELVVGEITRLFERDAKASN